MCVENDTLKGEKYTGTALDFMAAVQTTIDGKQGGAGKQKRQSLRLLAGYISDDNIAFLERIQCVCRGR